MPLSTADVPSSEKRRRSPSASSPEASPSSSASSASEAPPSVDVSLLPAGESSDPAVHHLIAERETATANGDTAAADAVTAALAKLGYR